ncbi:hypothetical protein EHO59_04065 [Leptospira semungkisensis]|uniref:Uncharacterized protein n=1 Tax=Leptospira semungkisensis TaxID=2484985 RepID=A0A4R9G6S2_9LEPT|nr:hypothetical protein [Leptospira semungkisensis]TGK07292.1 hypothetical protein EHO59_04065 [Leptospira semungkisensis]
MFRINIKPDQFRILILILPFLFLQDCRTYEIRLKEGVDESKVEKFKVPRKPRFPFFHEEEDLTYLCGKGELVFVKFRGNVPREVWCEGMAPSLPKEPIKSNP